jgi:hypothetical protein
MTTPPVMNPAVARLIAAVNAGDRAAFLAAVAPDAVLTDDGKPQDLAAWIDREIFTVHGHMTVRHEHEGGLRMLVRYRNDTWGEMSTLWRFEVTGDLISRIDTGQA